MSAANVIVSPNGDWAAIATDTICYDDDGTITAFETKVVTFPHKMMALVVRGEVRSVSYATTVAQMFPSFDLFLECAPLVFIGTWDEQAKTLGPKPGMDLAVVGYSDSEQRIVAAYASSRNDFAFQRGNIIIAPDLEPEQLLAAGFTVTGNGIAVTDPAKDLLKILELQRRTPADLPEGGTGYVIGGHAVLTVMNRSRITQQVLHRWPDEIGATITLGEDS